jgi:hypothetical protein
MRSPKAGSGKAQLPVTSVLRPDVDIEATKLKLNEAFARVERAIDALNKATAVSAKDLRVQFKE